MCAGTWTGFWNCIACAPTWTPRSLTRIALPAAFAETFCMKSASGWRRGGALRLFALKIASSIVAMRLGFVAGDSLYFYYSVFDPP
jgi:hypothetical protein